MLTIINAVELSSKYLEKKGVESPRLNAEMLLAFVLGCKRMDLYLKFDQPLSEEETTNYREKIKRRGQREPLQYIVGSVEFYGLEFLVNENVLIPRSETELLVEEIINKYKDKTVKILDIGSGSGNIAITLASNIDNSLVTSIDINKEAIDVGLKNAANNNINGKVDFINVGVEEFNSTKKYDIIVSNPPYISLSEYSTLEPELLNFEPKNALTDEKDGYNFYKIISKRANKLLNENGELFFEIGIGQSEKISDMMIENGFKDLFVKKDYQDIDRVISGTLK